MTDISIAIVGGGVVGCAIARELSDTVDNIFLFEKNIAITKGENQSSRNSGVIHSGLYYDIESRPQKAKLCVEGNRLLYEFCARYEVPAFKTGKLLVAASSEEEDVLEYYLGIAKANGVPDVKLISGSEVKDKEPNVVAKSALFVPTAGIIDPTALVYRLHAIASGSGVKTMTDTEVIALEPDGDRILLTIEYRDGRTDQIRAKTVINAGGVEADRIACLLDPDSPFELDPIKGESYKFFGHKRTDIRLHGMNVYPTPKDVETSYGRHFTVGVHLTPTFENTGYPPTIGSTVTIGPRLVPVKDRNSSCGPVLGPDIFINDVKSFFPGLKEEDLLWHQDGLQARLKGYHDFIIHTDSRNKSMINLLGIDSPGLTSCLAIARRVKEIIYSLGV